ncbi:hypothetical protein A8B78_13060 [Jannaschia sp. EhC01]|nr:hypothetical protein A8B78_13060 [Jannaschia sp. EhC01]
MTFLTTLRSIVGAAALSLIAGAASASTMTFADLSLSGDFTHTDEITVCPFGCFTIPIPSIGTANGSISGNLYGDTSIVRDYTLTYDLSATWNGSTESASGAIDIPLAFSIDDVLASFGALVGSTGPVATVTPIGAFSSSGLTITPTSINGDFGFILGGPIFEDFADFVGLSGNQSGSVQANFALVAAIPLPASSVLLVFGLGGMVVVGRRRRMAA